MYYIQIEYSFLCKCWLDYHLHIRIAFSDEMMKKYQKKLSLFETFVESAKVETGWC